MDIVLDRPHPGGATLSTQLDDLQQFLLDWDKQYLSSVKKIPLFDSAQTNLWNQKQKEYFVKTFYHARGHFHEVLWHMGNFAPNAASKKVILHNVSDEFGAEKGLSHEVLYLKFAEAVGVDLKNEFIIQKYYLPFLKDFNRGLLEWLNVHDWDERISFFAALERLDNVDYLHGKNLATSLGVPNSALTFFIAHINADHFEDIHQNNLLATWEHSPSKVHLGFQFVLEHQVKMWNNLSNTIFNYKE